MDRPTIRGRTLLVCWALGSTLVGRGFVCLALSPFDSKLFAYFGLQWLHGYIPYVDLWDNKPPGIFAVNALVFLLFPKNFTALAALEGLVTLGCIGTVYLLMRRWGGPWLATALATTSVAIVSNLFYYTEGGNLTEIYLLWPAALSMYCFSKASPTFQGKWVLLAGFCSGVASLFKPVGLSPLLAQGTFVILLWVVFRRLSGQQLLASGFANSAGALIAWLPFVIYFLRHNALGELVEASVTYNLHYGMTSYGSIPFAIVRAMAKLRPLASIVVSVVVGAIIYMGRCALARHSRATEERSRQALCFWWPLALLWVVFDFAGALAGGRSYPHYFLTLAASLSVAAGLTYWFLIGSISDAARCSSIGKALFALIIGPLLLPQMSEVYQLRQWVLLPSKHYAWAEDLKGVATHLNAIRGSADTLFTWDYMPEVYFTTEMNTPMRLLDAHYIFDSSHSLRKFGEEIFRGLEKTPPVFLVDGWNHAADERLRAGEPLYRKFRELIEHHYVWTYTAGKFRVYRHQAHREVIAE